MTSRELIHAILVMFGLNAAEQWLLNTGLSVNYRIWRAKERARFVFPYVAVTLVLAAYAAGATTLAYRKFRAAVPEPDPQESDAPAPVIAEQADAESNVDAGVKSNA